MTRTDVRIVVGVEIALVLVGVSVCLAVVLTAHNARDVPGASVVAAVATGLAASSAYYLRRLYRAGFDGRLNLLGRDEHSPERVASLIYLLGRPMISLPLSLVASLIAILTNTAVSPSDVAPTANLIYVNAGVGFIAGFLGGRMIQSVERTGKL